MSRVAGAATTVYTGAATGDAANFNNPNNWMTGAVPTSVDAAVFNDAGLTNAASGVIDTGASQSVSQLVFGGPAYPLSNPADATFSLNNNAVTLNSVASTSSAALYRSNASVGTQTINTSLVLAKTGEQFYLNGSTGSVVINGVIAQVAGVSAFLTKAGNGTVELAGVNTFSGGFGLVGGTAIVDNAAALGADTTDPVAVSNASSGFAASLLTNTGVTLPYNISVVASTSTPGLQVTLGGAPGQTASTWTGTVTLNRNVTLVGGSGGTTTFAGVISNANGITPIVSKLATGTVVLSAPKHLCRADQRLGRHAAGQQRGRVGHGHRERDRPPPGPPWAGMAISPAE